MNRKYVIYYFSNTDFPTTHGSGHQEARLVIMGMGVHSHCYSVYASRETEMNMVDSGIRRMFEKPARQRTVKLIRQ